ncbi:MAG: PHB depolymerase family esterase, partial [Ramlibacter sp.]|nr:PHB depolymerase family esterase [Ramlibacter sp.]
AWSRAMGRSMAAVTSQSLWAAGFAGAAKNPFVPPSPAGRGDWIAGVTMGGAGARRYRLYRPSGTQFGERLPLLVMLHGCGQDASSFADSTRMNRVAERERFLVLYPEQDRLANSQGCWNWYDTRGGRAGGETQLVMNAIEQVCLLYCADPTRVAVAGLSAGASLAALLATRHPERFKAVVMHSGIPPGTAHSTLSALAAMRGTQAVRAEPPAVVHQPASDSAWPPLLVIHGGKDRTVCASNGLAAVQMWAQAAGASAQPPKSLTRGKRHAMAVTDFKSATGTAATLVEVDQLGHAWSGGAASQPHGDAQGPDASRMTWAFAVRQFRR